MEKQTSQTSKKPTKICLKCGRGLRSNITKCTSCGCTDIMDKKKYRTLMEQYEKASFKEKQYLKNNPDFILINKYQFNQDYNKQLQNYNHPQKDDSFDLLKSIGCLFFVGLSIISLIYGILSSVSFLLCFIFAIICIIIAFVLMNSISKQTKQAVDKHNHAKKEQVLNNGYKCPNCGKHAGYEIDVTKKSASICVFGLASNKVGKTYKCKNCGYYW